MNYEKMTTALAIISTCDALTITEDDKKLIISVLGTIIKSLREKGLDSFEMDFQYALLKDSTWNDGYFCIIAKQMCNMVYKAIKDRQLFDLLESINAN